ncbi:MAG: hypothetical protein Q9191_003624 [Dirinaria sp. TL-2023a]
MSQSANLTPWPPLDGLSTVVVPRSSSILHVSGSTRIAAPASFVFSIVLDTASYPKWNSFVPRATINSQPPSVPEEKQNVLHKDTHFVFHAIMDQKKPDSVSDTKLRVTDYSTPDQQSGYVPEDLLENDGSFHKDQGQVYRVTWTVEGAFLTLGLSAQRFHEIIVLGEQECELRTWECYGGILARVVKFMYKDVLQAHFERYCQELKMEAEKRVADSKPK